MKNFNTYISEKLKITKNTLSKQYNNNGHEFVDLGLPSGTLWATLNIGAFSIYDPGYYYAWGELETKPYYDFDNYVFRKGGHIRKYNGVDNKKILEPVDDTAHCLWGGNWKMPTNE